MAQRLRRERNRDDSLTRASRTIVPPPSRSIPGHAPPAPATAGHDVLRSTSTPDEGQFNVRRLRLVTIVAPIVFLLAIELLSIFVLIPLYGNRDALRLVTIFAILVVGTVPFSFWVFSTIERQQRALALNASVLDQVKQHAILMLDPEGNILTWNPGAERLKGYRGDEIIGRNIASFYLPEAVEAGLPARNLEIAAVQGQVEDEGWRVRRDGSRFWADVVSTSVRDETGNLVGFTHVVRDATDRKEAEDRIHALNQELERRVAELRQANEEVLRRNRQLAAINTAITSVSSRLDLASVLQNIADAARELVQSHYAALGVADEEGRIAQFITSGITDQEREAIGPPPQGHGLLAVLIRDGKPLRIPDIGVDPRSRGFPPNHPPMTTLLGVPILYQGHPVGDLYLADKIRGELFTEEDQELVMLLASHAAVAIENARLYGEVREARDRLQVWNEELEQKVAERTREIERYSKELTTRVLQAQEEERKRIARELHDDTAQSLSTLLINLDLLEPFVPADNEMLRQGCDRVRAIAKRTLDVTRALSHDLRPTILDDFGLVAALHWYADEFEKTFRVPVEVTAEAVPAGGFSPEIELALFRIAQEALTNTGKYAAARRATVSLSFPPGQVNLTVEDNGKGFDVTKVIGPTRQGGLGLHGIQERAELISADLQVDSRPGHGTRISVLAPLPADEAATGTDDANPNRGET